jgi:hypothetical protein
MVTKLGLKDSLSVLQELRKLNSKQLLGTLKLEGLQTFSPVDDTQSAHGFFAKSAKDSGWVLPADTSFVEAIILTDCADEVSSKPFLRWRY